MKYSAQHRDGSLSCRQCNKPLNHSKNDCCERLTLQYKEQHFSVADTLEPARADFTVWSAYDAMYKTLIVYGQMNKREKRDRTTSVSRITKRKGQKFKTCNKWLTDASTDTGASTYSLGTRHKEGEGNRQSCLNLLAKENQPMFSQNTNRQCKQNIPSWLPQLFPSQLSKIIL